MGFLNSEQRATLTAACASLLPGPADAASEAGHPGSREAGVVDYIDGYLGCFTSEPPRLFAIRRTGGAPGPTGEFAPLTTPQRIGWRHRVAGHQTTYLDGIGELDLLARPRRFAELSGAERDRALSAPSLRRFRALLVSHAVQGMYADPVYGGNRDGIVWRDLGIAPPYADQARTEPEAAEPNPDLDELVTENFELLIGLLLRGGGEDD